MSKLTKIHRIFSYLLSRAWRLFS